MPLVGSLDPDYIFRAMNKNSHPHIGSFGLSPFLEC